MSKYVTSKVLISASHNFAESQEVADEKILAKAMRDVSARRDCVSYNFCRVKDAPIDENKFLMPMYGRVPILAHKILQRVHQGLEVVVVGSPEVGLLVEAMRDFVGVGEESLRYTLEGDSLAQNLRAGSKCLHLEPQESFIFEAGDTPLADELEDMLMDSDIRDHVGVADLNGKQTAFESEPFFARNYYWQVHDGTRYVECKEPNAWLFRSDFGLALTDSFYSTRQGGKLDMFRVLRMVGPGIVRQLPFITHTSMWDFTRGTAQGVLKKLGRATGQWYFHASTIENVSPALLGGKSFKFKVTHKDPFRIRDVDAWHDLWYYTHIAKAAQCSGTPQAFLPNYSQVLAFDEFMNRHDLAHEIGVLRDFAKFANQRAMDLGMQELPFSPSGGFQASLERSTSLPATMQFLKHRQYAYSKTRRSE